MRNPQDIVWGSDYRGAMETMDEFISSVREREYDRFLAIQLAPMEKRAALYALTTLFIELSHVAEIVSETLIGHIRLAWWREALEEIANGQKPRQHPLVLALAEVYATHPQSWPSLQRMVEGFAAELDAELLASEEGWLNYLDTTSGALHAAWAMILDEVAAPKNETLIAKQARRFAIIAQIRAIPFMAQHGWVRFPSTRINAQGLQSLEPSASLPHLVRELMQVEALMKMKLPRSLKPLRALDSLSNYHTKRLVRAGFDPYHLRPAKLGAVLRILGANIN